MLTLRPLQRNDIPILTQIDAVSNDPPWNEDNFSRELNWTHSLSRIAIWEGVPIGFGITWKVCEEAQILEIAVLPDYRRKKVATHIVRELAMTAEKLGCKKMVLELRCDNRVALKFYENLGFNVVGKRKNFYAPKGSNQNIDALLMACALPL